LRLWAKITPRELLITAPSPFAYVGGSVVIRGQLDLPDLQYYQLSYGQGLDPSSWIDITGREVGYSPDAPLGEWDTDGLDGLYTLLLVAVATDNTYESEAIQVTVDNVAPSITLTTEAPDDGYQFPRDESIVIHATAADNLAVARVEFFRDGDPLGADEAYPFGLEWRIESAGAETFTAVVYDQVGNSAQAEIRIAIGRSS